MLSDRRSSSSPRRYPTPVRFLIAALVGAAAAGAGCADDEAQLVAECVPPEPVDLGISDAHCRDAAGESIIQPIGACASSVMADADHVHEAAELHVFEGNAAYDDECKYEVSFTNTCIAVDQDVTFSVSLTRRMAGTAATGADPSPEVYMEADGHLSPSNNSRVSEREDGLYDIGPIVFDRSGRWVVRFHFFEMCSDLLEDSPHAHVAFYVDVP